MAKGGKKFDSRAFWAGFVGFGEGSFPNTADLISIMTRTGRFMKKVDHMTVEREQFNIDMQEMDRLNAIVGRTPPGSYAHRKAQRKFDALLAKI